MKKLTILIIGLNLFAACDNKTSDTKVETVISAEDSISSNKDSPSFTGCYMMVIEKDTAYMHLDDSAGYFTGHLSYKRFEKDSNRGTVTVKADKDKLKGWYSFFSEGQLSKREIIFKVNGSALAEGYGDVEMKDDTVTFKYPATLNFEDRHTFKKTECK